MICVSNSESTVGRPSPAFARGCSYARLRPDKNGFFLLSVSEAGGWKEDEIQYYQAC